MHLVLSAAVTYHHRSASEDTGKIVFGGFDRHRHTRQAQPQVSVWNEIKVAMVLCCGTW